MNQAANKRVTPGLGDVRALLQAIVTGSTPPTRVPLRMLELALRALPPWQRNEDASQDLVGDLLLHLAEVTHAGDRRSALHLLELDDAHLEAAIRQRLRQLAAETNPRWLRVGKPLRSHLRSVLEQSLPTVDALPLSLMRGDKLSEARVAEAAAYLQDAHPELRGDVAALASELMALYFPDGVHLEPERWSEVAATNDWQAVDDLEDAPAVAARAREILGDELTAMIGLRGHGMSFEAIGKHRGHATSTVFERVRAGIERLRVGLAEEASPESLRLALGALADSRPMLNAIAARGGE